MTAGLAPVGGGGNQNEGGIPSAPQGLREPPARAIVKAPTGAKTDVIAAVAGTAHIILAVDDDGAPSLATYRRIVLNITAK